MELVSDLLTTLLETHGQASEVEVRFGFMNQRFFDTNIKQQLFQKIVNYLRMKKKGFWEGGIEESITTDYYGQDHVRTTVDHKTGTSFSITKQKVANFDFLLTNTPFDMRIAVNEERPLPLGYQPNNLNFSSIRTKERVSFLSTDFRVDATTVSNQKRQYEPKQYQIEIELMYPKHCDECWFESVSTKIVLLFIELTEHAEPGCTKLAEFKMCKQK